MGAVWHNQDLKVSPTAAEITECPDRTLMPLISPEAGPASWDVADPWGKGSGEFPPAAPERCWEVFYGKGNSEFPPAAPEHCWEVFYGLHVRVRGWKSHPDPSHWPLLALVRELFASCWLPSQNHLSFFPDRCSGDVLQEESQSHWAGRDF